VQVNFAAGKAQLHVQNLPVEEYFTLPNALADGPEIDATISFDAVWSGPVTRRLNFQNGAAIDPFAGEFVENQVTVSWSGSNANGFSFTSNRAISRRAWILFPSWGTTAMAASSILIGQVRVLTWPWLSHPCRFRGGIRRSRTWATRESAIP
jgi:hypothetical protein